MEIQKRTTLMLAIDETMELLNRLYFTGKISVGGKTVAIPKNIKFEIELDSNRNEGELEFEFSWSKGKKKTSPLVLFLIHHRKEREKLRKVETIFKRVGIRYKIQIISQKVKSRQLRSFLSKESKQGVELFIVDEIINLKFKENLKELIAKPVLTTSYKPNDLKNISNMAVFILGIKYTEITELYRKYCLTK